MRRLINKIGRIIKNEKFIIDESIPILYLFFLFLLRFWMFIRGKLAFINNGGLLFIGKNVTIKCKSKIKFGRAVSVIQDSYIDALSINGIVFGDNVSLGRSSSIECTGSLKSLGVGLQVGNNVGLGSHGFFGCAGGVKIGDDTIFGNFVSIHSENHNFNDLDTPIRLQGVNRKGITIGKNCWIGAKVTILDGVVIEEGCIIAAGSLVTKGNYLKNCIYAGVPAKIIKKRY